MRRVVVLVLAFAMCGVGGAGANETMRPREVMRSAAPGHMLLRNLHAPTRIQVRAPAARLRKRPQPLAVQARSLAAHGGVYSHGYGAASPAMKQLTVRLILQRFGRSASRALCFARRESGLNPLAVSSSDDHGALQVNRPTHPQFDYRRMDTDPAYGVWAGWVVSNHGTDWQPWAGGSYPC